MLSKLRMIPSSHTDFEVFNKTIEYSIKPRNTSSCQKLDIWRATLSNNKTVFIEVGKLYDIGNFKVSLDSEEHFNMNTNCNFGTIVISDFDYNIVSLRQLKETWIEINNTPFNMRNKIPNITQSEKYELYRLIYKWDVVEREEKSSGSESESDSDFDDNKLSRNNCKLLTTKYAIVNGYKII